MCSYENFKTAEYFPLLVWKPCLNFPLWKFYCCSFVHGIKRQNFKGIIFMHYRSSQQRCSVNKGVLENFTKFTRKQLWKSLFFNEILWLQGILDRNGAFFFFGITSNYICKLCNRASFVWYIIYWFEIILIKNYTTN